MSTTAIYPFNNYVETGLRVLTILTSSFPVAYDIDHLIYFDFMVVHSGDINRNETSLHPPVPNRRGEIVVIRTSIKTALDIFSHKGLIDIRFTETGILYSATESSVPFLESLSEDYTLALMSKAQWLMREFGTYDLSTLRELFDRSMEKTRNEFNLDII